MRPTVLLIGILFLATIIRSAQAVEVSFSTPRTFPKLEAELGLGQPLFIEVRYSSDRETRFQAKAFRDGKIIEIGQVLNTPLPQPAGKQSILVWVRLNDATKADEIRITAFDDTGKPVAVRSLKADLRWARPAAQRSGNPDWVDRLLLQQEEFAKQRRERVERESKGTIGNLLGWVSGSTGG